MGKQIISNGYDFKEFQNIDEVEKYIADNYKYILKEGRLCEINGKPISIKEALSDQDYSLKPLKKYTDNFGIAEQDVAIITSENQEIIFTTKSGRTFKCKM